eukprot:COSAG02_NODE_2227_length_9447_cov_3.361682_6_plen_1148_part_00
MAEEGGEEAPPPPEAEAEAPKDPMMSSADLEGADKTAAQFKTKVVLAEHTPQEINSLWKKLQFQTTPVDLTQFTRQHNILIENALTALAKNVRNLNETTKQSQEDILMNTKAIGRISGKPVDTEEEDKKFADLLAQFESFKDSTTQQITQLTSEVSAQKAENAALKQEVGRLGPLAEQMKQMGQELKHVAATAEAASEPDFSPVWDATEQLVIRLGRVEAESEAHAKQIDHTLHVIATESAADDVLQNLDEGDLELLNGPDGGDSDDMEESQLYGNLLNQTKALGSKALDKQFSSGMMSMFGLEEIGVDKVFHHWATLVSRVPRRTNSPMRQPQEPVQSAPAPMGAGIVGADGEFERPDPVRLPAPPAPLETLDAPALKERAIAAGVTPEVLAQAEAEGLEPEKLVQLIKEADAPAAEARRTELESMPVAALTARAAAAGVPPEKIEAMVKQMEASGGLSGGSAPGGSAGGDGSTSGGDDASGPASSADPEQMAAMIAMIEEIEGPASLVGNPAFSPQPSLSPRESTSPEREAPRASAPAPQRSDGGGGGASSGANTGSGARSNSPVRRGRSPDGKPVGNRSSPTPGGGARPSSRASPNYERATTPATAADRQPQDDHLSKQVEERLGRKMEAKVIELQMQTDIKALKAAMERHANELKAQANSEELDLLREELAKCQGEVASMKSAVDAVGRAATEAAASAAKANEGLQGLQKEMAETDLSKLNAEVKKLGELGPQLTKLEGAFGSAAAEWDAASADMQNKLEPLSNVPKTLHELMNEVGRKVDGAELGRIQMALEDLGKELADVRTAAGQAAEKASQSGLPQDALDALKDLTDLKNMKGTMKQHAKKLADLFNKKASIDDINQATSMMKELDQKLAAEVESRASSIMGEMGATRNELQAKLDSIGRTIDEKADEAWLKTLEDQIRLEMEALRKKAGGKGITPQALEAKLAELRAKLNEAGGLHEAGSAVFRCIACDRPLPSVDGWQGPQHQQQPGGSGGGQIGGPDRKRKGLKENHAEVIMKGGFPMSNPKYDKERTHGPAFGKGGAHGSTAALRGDGGAGAATSGRPKNLPPLQPPQTPDTSSRPASGGRKGSAGRRERLSHDGGYSRSSVGADGTWPPPSVPHYDAWGTDEGRSRPITPDGGR